MLKDITTTALQRFVHKFTNPLELGFKATTVDFIDIISKIYLKTLNFE